MQRTKVESSQIPPFPNPHGALTDNYCTNRAHHVYSFILLPHETRVDTHIQYDCVPHDVSGWESNDNQNQSRKLSETIQTLCETKDKQFGSFQNLLTHECDSKSINNSKTKE